MAGISLTEGGVTACGGQNDGAMAGLVVKRRAVGYRRRGKTAIASITTATPTLVITDFLFVTAIMIRGALSSANHNLATPTVAERGCALSADVLDGDAGMDELVRRPVSPPLVATLFGDGGPSNPNGFQRTIISRGA